MSDEPTGGQGQQTGAGAGDTPSFLDTLSEDLRGNEAFKDITSADELAKQVLEMKGAQPSIPDNIEGYSFSSEREIPEADMQAVKDAALELKFTNEQFQGILKFQQAREEAILNDLNQKAESTLEQLKTDFGDNYDANMQMAQKVANAFESGKDLLSDYDVGNNPNLFKFLVDIGKRVSEDSLGKEMSGQQGTEGKSRADVLYPSSAQQ